jgi:hypothetical protein
LQKKNTTEYFFIRPSLMKENGMKQMEKMENVPDGRCGSCKFLRIVTATGGLIFYGCYHKPYKGKWVCEIKTCPKEQL